jgi:protein-ribulosamine 3-kinase
MKKASDLTFYQIVLEESLRKPVKVLDIKVKSGGCISHAAEIVTSEGRFFMKWLQASGPSMYATEWRDLSHLYGKSSLKIPQPLYQGETQGQYYFVMEALDVVTDTSAYWEHLGFGLAELHRNTAPEHGLNYNNFIGRLPQRNNTYASWHTFFVEERLNVQLEMALERRLVDIGFAKKFTQIYQKIPELLPALPPSLLHGDLWSGNILATKGDIAALIDPAVYYGSREIELAFTYLFGGFDDRFYSSYHEAFPLPSGFRSRVDIYNLYPLMVHVNIFGVSYLKAVQDTINRYQ